jgi:hypothetical protein
MIRRFARYGILFAMLLILTGCNITSDRSDKPSPDWSRGLRVGVASINQPVALQVDGEGHAHLVWYAGTEEASKLQYAQLDDQAQIVVERDLDIPFPDPERPQLLLDRQGNMHLAWLAGEDGAEDGLKSLFHFLLGYDGEALSEPTRLSPPGKKVEGYQMCLGQEGRVEVFWSAEEGIYSLGLDERGEVISPPTLIIPQGTDPSVQVDRSGTIHLAWLQEPASQVKELYYGLYESGKPVEGIKLTQFGKGVTVVLYGPVLGLDTEYVYIFWALEHGAGVRAGIARLYYVSFPLGQASPLASTLLRISNLEPVYTSSQGEYNYRWLTYSLEGQGSDFLAMPSIVEGQQQPTLNELAVVFNARVTFGVKASKSSIRDLETTGPGLKPSPGSLVTRFGVGRDLYPTRPGLKPEIQLAMAVFTKGKMKGYELVANTGSVSMRPNLQVDPASNLHLAWIDAAGFGRYDVYYASTSSEAKARLDRTSPQDVLLKAAELGFGILSGMALLPLAGFWVLPPLIWMGLFYLLAGEEDLELRRVKVALGIAVALYLGAKLVFLPFFLFYVPFLDQVPPQFSPALVFGVPLIILALALAAMYAHTRRTEEATLFRAFLVFALTDALLSMAIYAPSFFTGL